MNEDENNPEVKPEQQTDEPDESGEETLTEEESETQEEPSLPDAKPKEEPKVETSEEKIARLENEAGKFRRLYEKKVKEQPKGEFVTKEELYKREEKQAVRNVTIIAETDNEDIKEQKAEIKENWDAIMRHFHVDDRSDADVVEEGIYDAYAVWKRRGGNTKGDTSVAAKLSMSTGKGGTGKTKEVPTEMTFFKKQQPPEEWYPKIHS